MNAVLGIGGCATGGWHLKVYPQSATAAKIVRNHVSIKTMPNVSIIVPTFKEVENVEELLRRLQASLRGVDWEVVFVDDDSPDGTADTVRNVAQADRRVRCVHRIGRRGLASACVEGILSSSAPFIAVMDADLQHDEALLPRMLDEIRAVNVDIVVGSRYIEGGSVGEWDSARALLSRVATRLGKVLLKADLSDPMSGFFMIRRDVAVRSIRNGARGIGFKILLDIFASSPEPLRWKELPYRFRNRHAGQSKLDTTVAWEYFLMLVDKLVGHIVPVRFVAFSLVGGLGVVMHMTVLVALHKVGSVSFFLAQATATLAAMTLNFWLNNVLTYRDVRLRGWGLLRGWLSFVLACSVGAVANVGIAVYLFAFDTFWVTSAIAGVLVGAVWNYAITAVYTWRRPQGA